MFRKKPKTKFEQLVNIVNRHNRRKKLGFLNIALMVLEGSKNLKGARNAR